MAVVGGEPGRVLGLDLGPLRRAGLPALRAGAGLARDARRGVVHRRAAVLRAARARGPRRLRRGHAPRLRAARAGHGHPRRAARAGGADRRRPEGPGRRAGGPGGRLHAQHRRGAGRVPGLRVDRRRLVIVLAGLRRQVGGRPLPADRAEGAARGRRLPLQRQGLRPARDRGGHRRGDRRADRVAGLPGRHRLAGRVPGGGRRAGVRPAAVRPPAVGALQLGHHRAAQGDRARPGRHPARAPEEDAPARGRAEGRPRVLVHHHRLDDVELPGRRAAHRRRDRPVRRQPGPPRPERAVGPGRARPGRRRSAPRPPSCPRA